MPIFKQFGLSNIIGSVINLGSGVGYWTMDHPSSNPSPGTIEIDFGYKVALKSLYFDKTNGSMGTWDIVGSNTAATSTADVYDTSRGDVRVNGYYDDLGRNLFHAGFNATFRYYRLLLVGDATKPNAGLPSLGPDFNPISPPSHGSDPHATDNKLINIVCNAAMVATAFGFITASGLISNIVDDDGATSWAPYATGWPDTVSTTYPPNEVDDAFVASKTKVWPALQIDMGEAVAMTTFAFTANNAATLGAAALYASNNPATSLDDTVQSGDIRIGTYTAAQLCSGASFVTDLSTTGTPYRYYRFLSAKGIGSGPDGTSVSAFTPGFYPPRERPAVTWNPLDKTSNITLSLDRLTGTIGVSSFTNEGVRSIGVQHSTGKWYIEFTNVLSGGGAGRYGFAAIGDTLGTHGQVGVSPGGYLEGPVGNVGLTDFPDGHTICIAIDLDNLLCWARLDGGTWNNNALADPSTAAHGLDITGITTPLYIYLWEQAISLGHATLNAGGSAFLQSVPTLFQAWAVPGDTFYGFFTDDGGLNDIVISLTPPGSPFVVRLADGDSDALTGTLTIKANTALQVAFTDEANFDIFSDIFPSTIVQTMVFTTGR